MRPTEELKDEHRVIERMLGIVVKAADKMDAGEVLDRRVFTGAAEFFREFADRCHHGKEERQLFQKMVERGMSSESGPIAVVLHEHEEGRAHVRAIGKLAEKPPEEYMTKELVRHVREYVEMLGQHIQKEDNVLYPIADNILTKEDIDVLENGFREIEEKVMGPGVHEKYHRMIEEFERELG